MTKIITTTQVQKKIGQLSQEIMVTNYIVTNRGTGKIVMLPYFDGCDENIAEYMEHFEMMKNREKLRERYKKSSKSGKGSLWLFLFSPNRPRRFFQNYQNQFKKELLPN